MGRIHFRFLNPQEIHHLQHCSHPHLALRFHCSILRRSLLVVGGFSGGFVFWDCSQPSDYLPLSLPRQTHFTYYHDLVCLQKRFQLIALPDLSIGSCFEKCPRKKGHRLLGYWVGVGIRLGDASSSSFELATMDFNFDSSQNPLFQTDVPSYDLRRQF